jgi:hypothetical protein
MWYDWGKENGIYVIFLRGKLVESGHLKVRGDGRMTLRPFLWRYVVLRIGITWSC